MDMSSSRGATSLGKNSVRHSIESILATSDQPGSTAVNRRSAERINGQILQRRSGSIRFQPYPVVSCVDPVNYPQQPILHRPYESDHSHSNPDPTIYQEPVLQRLHGSGRFLPYPVAIHADPSIRSQQPIPSRIIPTSSAAEMPNTASMTRMIPTGSNIPTTRNPIYGAPNTTSPPNDESVTTTTATTSSCTEVSSTNTAPNTHRFLCRECGASYSQASSLSRHKRSHRGVESFPCQRCGYSFARSDALDRHIKNRVCYWLSQLATHLNSQGLNKITVAIRRELHKDCICLFMYFL